MNLFKTALFFLLILSFSCNHSLGQVSVKVKQSSLNKISNELTGVSIRAISNNKYLSLKGKVNILLAIDYDERVKKLKGDGFIIKNLQDGLILISGRSVRATRNGVNFFAEKFLGAYYLLPGDGWTEYNRPQQNINDKNIIIVSEPSFYMRYLSPLDMSKENEYSIWAIRNNLNHIVDYKHNLYNLFDYQDASKYSPIIKGKKKVRSSQTDQLWQPKFNESGIVNYSSNRILKYFKDNPNSNSFSLSINDSQNFDDNTQQNGINFLGMKNYSSEYYKWVNETVTEVNKKLNTTKQFGVLAYNNVITPPNFKLQKNILPFITYERYRWLKPKQKQFDLDNLKSWLKVSNNVGWYDYVYGINYLAPRSYFELISSYLKEGNSLGVKYYVAELYPNPLDGPKAWILSKLLWDVNLNVDILLKQWCELAVGKGSSESLYKFYKLWEGYWTNQAIKSNWYRDDAVYQRFNDQSYVRSIPNEYLQQSQILLNEVLKFADDDSHRRRAQEFMDYWAISSETIKYFKNDSRNTKDKNAILKLLNKLPESRMNSEYKIYFKKHTKL